MWTVNQIHELFVDHAPSVCRPRIKLSRIRLIVSIEHTRVADQIPKRSGLPMPILDQLVSLGTVL